MKTESMYSLLAELAREFRKESPVTPYALVAGPITTELLLPRLLAIDEGYGFGIKVVSLASGWVILGGHIGIAKDEADLRTFIELDRVVSTLFAQHPTAPQLSLTPLPTMRCKD